MPNWCDNILTLSGSAEDLLHFATRITFDGRHYQIIRSLYPMPAEIAEAEDHRLSPEDRARLKAQYGASDWYGWALDHWGSKWADCDTQLTSHAHISDGVLDGRLEFRFQSAWSPPDAAIRQIATLFPNLSFVLEFGETGMGFRGYLTAEGEDCGTDYLDGEATCHHCGQIVDWDVDTCVFCGNHPVHTCPDCGRAHAEYLNCDEIDIDEED